MARIKSLSEVLRGVTIFGRLTIVGDAPDKVSPSGFAAKMARVRCECGTEKIVRAGDLKNGCAHSCGCLQRELAAERASKAATHGNTRKGARTSEYAIWVGMKARCLNEATHNYNRYGGRGIKVCERWRDSFEAFLADLGPRPSKLHSIDRVDGDGHYEPGNVQWATADDQAKNRSTTHRIEWQGQTLTATEAAKIVGITVSGLIARLKAGWSVDDLMTRRSRATA